jgi:2-oxoglutarate/2-oxoacid ferredoxin oxidoreductase subunit alpha
MEKYVIRVGGEAGWGIASAADILAKIFINLGYNIFSSKDYSSQIKAGHNYHTINISKHSIRADYQQVDLLLALDKVTIETHQDSLNENAIVLFKEGTEFEKKEGINYISIPLAKIEKELEQKNVRNAAFLGTAIKVLGIDYQKLELVLEEYFLKKEQLKEILKKAAFKGYELAEKEEKSNVPEIKNDNDQTEFITGNDAIVKGALEAGLTFHAQYPMTPVSGVLHSLAKEATNNPNLTVIQPEDEIATINFALGASYAGAKAMTATSGGGFALMVESLGLAGMAEVPLVIIEGQRPGPATGLPTKTEQGDLKFVLSAGTGDFPGIVIAPSDIEESYNETKRAFQLAEKYQLPVIVLVDKHLTESFKNINFNEIPNKFDHDFSKTINIIQDVDEKNLNKDGLFKRYQDKKLLRTLPGTVNGIYTCAGDEHDEVGYITENYDIRVKMMQRRMQKLELIEKELPDNEVIGPQEADLTIISWGSNKGAIIEALEKVNSEEGKKVNFLNIRFMLPFKTKQVKEILEKSKELLLIEANYTAQLASLIAEQTGIKIKNKFLRYDGRTSTIDETYQEIKKWLN